MPDETSNPPVAGAPVAAVKVVNPPAPQFQPWAFHFPPGLTDEILAEIDALAPKDAEPAHLGIAKSTVKAMIAALPPESRGCEVRLECLGGEGKQIMAQVTPRLVKKS